MNRRWFVTHVPSHTQREVIAPSAWVAIQLSGFPAHDCIAEEARGPWR